MSQGDTMTERLSTLGEFFRFSRRRSKLKQGEVAELVGVTKNTVSQIERGKQWPSMQTYLRLLDVLNEGCYDVTDHAIVDGGCRRVEVLGELGLSEWFNSLDEDELRYAFVRAWEGVELMREMERRGLEHPMKRLARAPLELLAPEEISARTQKAFKGLGRRSVQATGT